ncbi:hypothetical protein H4582DRAFT_1089786 [Lactarius indigo]|nr:hypothetical protein H4582DRAFT_1089786 [Lactarius indigo]
MVITKVIKAKTPRASQDARIDARYNNDNPAPNWYQGNGQMNQKAKIPVTRNLNRPKRPPVGRTIDLETTALPSCQAVVAAPQIPTVVIIGIPDECPSRITRCVIWVSAETTPWARGRLDSTIRDVAIGKTPPEHALQYVNTASMAARNVRRPRN